MFPSVYIKALQKKIAVNAGMNIGPKPTKHAAMSLTSRGLRRSLFRLSDARGSLLRQHRDAGVLNCSQLNIQQKY